MALPQAIAVRYTEEDAGYVTFRPVVRQTFRLDQLLDMVLSVTGKDPARVRLILHSGTVVFHFYRYWWDGFDADEPELNALLARFPDPDPARPFAPGNCSLAIVEGGSSPRRILMELARDAMSRKGFFQRKSFWDALLSAAKTGPLTYHGYSYMHRADMYQLDLAGNLAAQLAAAADSLAPRNLRKGLRPLAQASDILFACPRSATPSAPQENVGEASS